MLILADNRPTWITWVMADNPKLGKLIVCLGCPLGDRHKELRAWTSNGAWGDTDFYGGTITHDACWKVMKGEAAMMKMRPGQIPTLEDALAALGLD